MTIQSVPQDLDRASQQVLESVEDFKSATYQASTVTETLRIRQRLGELVTELQAVENAALEHAGLLCGRL